MTSRTLKIIRNIFMWGGIITGFIIWLNVPPVFKNTYLLHVGNGEYGSKMGILLILPLPLFALCFRVNTVEFHGDDKELISREREQADKEQMLAGMLTALALAVVVIGLMGGLCLDN